MINKSTLALASMATVGADMAMVAALSLSMAQRRSSRRVALSRRPDEDNQSSVLVDDSGLSYAHGIFENTLTEADYIALNKAQAKRDRKALQKSMQKTKQGTRVLSHISVGT